MMFLYGNKEMRLQSGARGGGIWVRRRRTATVMACACFASEQQSPCKPIWLPNGQEDCRLALPVRDYPA